MANPPYDDILQDGVEPAKADHRSHAQISRLTLLSSIAELQGLASGATALVYIKSTSRDGRLYEYDAADVASLDNGDTIIVTAGGQRFKLAGLLGRSGEAFDNVVMNGAMQIDQRAGGPYSALGYTLDRWEFNPGTGSTGEIDQAAGIFDDTEFSLSWDRTVAGSSSSLLDHNIEDVRTLSGQTATLSFDAVSDAGASVDMASNIDQRFGSGGSPTVGVGEQGVIVTTTPQRFSRTFVVPSVAGKTIGDGNHLEVRFRRSNNGADGKIRIGNVKLERGAAATPFQPVPMALELLMCQRFYQRYNVGMTGFARSATNVTLRVMFRVPMRATPTAALLDQSIIVIDEVTVNHTSAGSTIVGSSLSKSTGQFNIDGWSTLVGGRFVFSNQTVDWLELDAEL